MARKKLTRKSGPPPPIGPGQYSPYSFNRWRKGHTETFPVAEHEVIRNAVGNLNRNKSWWFQYALVIERRRERVRVWRTR